MSSQFTAVRVFSLTVMSICLSCSAQADGPAFTGMFSVADSAESSALVPAGMTRLDHSQTALQAIIGQGFGEFKVDEDVTTVSGGDPRDSNVVLVPSLYYVRPLADEWRLGLSVTVPAGFGTRDGPNWAGRYYSDQFDMVFVAANVTAARPVTDWLSLGGGVSIIGSSVTSKTQVNNIGLNNPDAKLKTDADGVGFGLIASALFELSPSTRFSVTWHSESEPQDDVDVELRRSTLPPALVDSINQQGNNIEAKIRVPQHVDFGAYHEFSNGWAATLDAMWIEYSRFGLTELSVDGANLAEADMGFEDFWVVMAGLRFPLSQRLQGRIGALYMESPMASADRTFSFDLDRVYGAGIGFHYTRDNKDSFDVNLSVFDSGDAPVDTGPGSELSLRGRVAGETDNPYGAALEFTYYWNR